MSTNSIGKIELINKVQESLNDSVAVSKDTLNTIIEATIEAIKASVKADVKVSLKGFGTFQKAVLKARTGVNPLTGTQLNVPARNKMAFKMSQSLKSELN